MRFLFSFFLLFFAATASAQVLGPGINTSGEFITATVSTLPGGPSTGSVRYVTDGASATDCLTGAGSTGVLCVYDGTDWVSIGSSGGVEADTPQTTFDRIANGDVAVRVNETKPWRFRGTGGGTEDDGADAQVSSLGVFDLVPVCNDLPNQCDRVTNIPTGFKYERQINSVPVWTLEATGLTNLTLNAEGTGNTITIPTYWDLDLVAVVGGVASHVWNDDPLSTACTPLAVTGTNRTTGVCTFPNSDGDYGRQISKHLPTGWGGSLDAEIWWKTTGTGNARFQIQTKCYADDEADDAAFNTASVVTAAAGTSARPNKQTITGITTTGCADEELMRIRFFRNRTEGSDTLNAALDVEKVIFKLRVSH